MTLHTAKGLEWPVVVMTGHGAWPVPSGSSRRTAAGLEEERRLCYVGLTRAKDKLYLTWARARRRGGELRPGIASRFLRAIPPGIVEERRTTSLVGARLGRERGGGRRRTGPSGTAGAGSAADRMPASARPSAASARGRGFAGHSPLRERRAGPPPPIRQRDHPEVSPAPDGISRSRSPSMTRRSASSSCWWPMPGWNVNGRAHEHRTGRGAPCGQARRAGGDGERARPAGGADEPDRRLCAPARTRCPPIGRARAVPRRARSRSPSGRTWKARCRSPAPRPRWRPSSPTGSSWCLATAPWRISDGQGSGAAGQRGS